jgi:hypothetical protein
MPGERVLATQQARDAAKQLLALTGSVKERVGRVIQQGGVLADPQRWDGGLAGKWRSDWGRDASQLNQTAAKLDELERRARQVVEDIFKADSGSPGTAVEGLSENGATTLAAANVTQVTKDGHYKIGDPEKPHIEFDNDFKYNSKHSDASDFFSKEKWIAKLRGAQILGILPDATSMYDHYWQNTGEPKEFDYEKAYKEDGGVRAGVDQEIARAQVAAEELIRAGKTDFSMTGQASGVPGEYYPKTEDWQKTIGDYKVWSHGHVHVNGNTVTMEITVNGEDRYNFNRGEQDIGTGAPDNENGRFTEIGWAKPFDTHGSLTRTVTWQLGEAHDTTPPVGGSDEPSREADRALAPHNPSPY